MNAYNKSDFSLISAKIMLTEKKKNTADIREQSLSFNRLLAATSDRFFHDKIHNFTVVSVLRCVSLGARDNKHHVMKDTHVNVVGCTGGWSVLKTLYVQSIVHTVCACILVY